jgi:hypothetical protein
MRARWLTCRRSRWRSGRHKQRPITPELVRRAAYDKCHRLPCFKRRFDKLPGLVDPDLDTAAAPLNPEAEAVPIRRQLRVELYAIAL